MSLKSGYKPFVIVVLSLLAIVTTRRYTDTLPAVSLYKVKPDPTLDPTLDPTTMRTIYVMMSGQSVDTIRERILPATRTWLKHAYKEEVVVVVGNNRDYRLFLNDLDCAMKSNATSHDGYRHSLLFDCRAFMVLVTPCQDEGHTGHYEKTEGCKYVNGILYASDYQESSSGWTFIGDDDVYVSEGPVMKILTSMDPLLPVSVSIDSAPYKTWCKFITECNPEIPQAFVATYLSRALLSSLAADIDRFLNICRKIPFASYDTAAGLWFWMNNASFLQWGQCAELQYPIDLPLRGIMPLFIHGMRTAQLFHDAESHQVNYTSLCNVSNMTHKYNKYNGSMSLCNPENYKCANRWNMHTVADKCNLRNGLFH